MYALKRIFAYGIDIVLVYLFSWVASFFLYSDILPINEVTLELISMAILPVSFGIPIVVLGIMEGTLGWTPGKLILFLRVQKPGGGKIGIVQGLLRQIIKTIAISFLMFGTLWALYGIITSGVAFYDAWLNIDVDDKKPAGLTDTQKNWRKHMQDQ